MKSAGSSLPGNTPTKAADLRHCHPPHPSPRGLLARAAGSRLICIRKPARANGLAGSRQLAAPPGSAYIRAHRGAGAHSQAVGSPGWVVDFPSSLASAPPSVLVDNLLLADRNMTLEELRGQDTVPESTARMQGAGKALHELLLSAQRQGCLTAGVYESAKVLNVDPDNVTFCVLAADEEDEGDIALQIHFTLIQAFCCENDIDIVRVGDVQRLAAIVGTGDESGAPVDLHCILISNPNEDAWKDPALEKLSLFCEESRSVNDWVPNITLPE
uniref:Growth arrest and DNA damage-inducible protein GADD45 gamma n=3 Tax=Bos TaxID=9903 RepID=A0A452DI17_BOVIN